MKYCLLIVALAALTPVLVAQDYGPVKPAPVPTVAIPLTPEQKAAIHAVNVRIGGIEALAEKIDDPGYKATVVASVADLKKRRAAMERNFDQGLYEALMHAVISRYQVVALWLRPPRVPAPEAKL
jgi:hypothetical protein